MKKAFYLSLRLAVAIILLIWLLYKIKFDELKELNLSNTAICVVAALFLMCCQIIFGAWRWKILLQAQGIKISLFRAISLSFQGNAFSLFICLDFLAISFISIMYAVFAVFKYKSIKNS